MKNFSINVWYRYGYEHDNTDFILEHIEAESEIKAIELITEKYKNKKINPFKIELSKN